MRSVFGTAGAFGVEIIRANSNEGVWKELEGVLG
jgi:hypothetical protein